MTDEEVAASVAKQLAGGWKVGDRVKIVNSPHPWVDGRDGKISFISRTHIFVVSRPHIVTAVRIGEQFKRMVPHD